MQRIPFEIGEYYHLYNRGVNKMPIFNDDWDYIRFQKLLYLCNIEKAPKFSDVETSPGRTWTVEKKDTLVEIGTYCLMPNHFHILIKTKDPINTSKFIQKVLTSYSMYFNKKYNRTGALFQGKTRGEHAKTDRYLKYLYSYIHLNPVKIIDSKWKEEDVKDLEKTLNFLKSYKYSSFLDYINVNRNENKVINKNEFPLYFNNPEEHTKELIEWLKFKNV